MVGQGRVQRDQRPRVVAADEVARLGHRPLDLDGRPCGGQAQAGPLRPLQHRAAGRQDGLAQLAGGHHPAGGRQQAGDVLPQRREGLVPAPAVHDLADDLPDAGTGHAQEAGDLGLARPGAGQRLLQAEQGRDRSA